MNLAGVIIGALVGLGSLVMSKRRYRNWADRVKTEFQQALEASQIQTQTILVERIAEPGPHTTGEVYRILRSLDGRYFVYIHVEGSPAVVKPLTEERALLAAKTCGYVTR